MLGFMETSIKMSSAAVEHVKDVSEVSVSDIAKLDGREPTSELRRFIILALRAATNAEAAGPNACS
jgi:hypothetical protein